MGYNALVLILPEINETKPDYTTFVMSRVAKHVREKISGLIILIAPFEDKNLQYETPQLSSQLGLTKEDTPGIWLIHS